MPKNKGKNSPQTANPPEGASSMVPVVRTYREMLIEELASLKASDIIIRTSYDVDHVFPRSLDAGEPTVHSHRGEPGGAEAAEPAAPAGEAENWIGEAPPPTVPRAGEIMARLFCERDRREDVLAVLADRFEDKARDHGARHARRWYWREVARSFGPFAWQWVRRTAELATLLKLIGF